MELAIPNPNDDVRVHIWQQITKIDQQFTSVESPIARNVDPLVRKKEKLKKLDTCRGNSLQAITTR
jgi:hypothetical protein